jgi:hypothetical protein
MGNSSGPLQPSSVMLDCDRYRQFILQSGVWFAAGKQCIGICEELPSAPETRHKLLMISAEQKMLPMLISFLRERNEAPEELFELENFFRLRSDAMYSALEFVLQESQLLGISVLLLKGTDLAVSVYPAKLPRMMRDIDILALPPDLSSIDKAVQVAGFVQGRYNVETLTIEPYSQAQMEWYHSAHHYELPGYSRFVELTKPYELPKSVLKYVRPFGYRTPVIRGRAFVPVKLDVHFNVSTGVDVQDMWNGAREIRLPNERVAMGQSPTTMLWFLISRFYHEVMQSDRGLIRQFIDVIATIVHFRDAIDWDHIVFLGRKYGTFPSLYYVLWHVNEILGPLVPAATIGACYPAQAEVRRDHDWGDFMPRLLGGVMTAKLV